MTEGQGEFFPRRQRVGGRRQRWEHVAFRLNERKKLIGRAGIARCREALRNATPFRREV